MIRSSGAKRRRSVLRGFTSHPVGVGAVVRLLADPVADRRLAAASRRLEHRVEVRLGARRARRARPAAGRSRCRPPRTGCRRRRSSCSFSLTWESIRLTSLSLTMKSSALVTSASSRLRSSSISLTTLRSTSERSGDVAQVQQRDERLRVGALRGQVSRVGQHDDVVGVLRRRGRRARARLVVSPRWKVTVRFESVGKRRLVDVGDDERRVDPAATYASSSSSMIEQAGVVAEHQRALGRRPAWLGRSRDRRGVRQARGAPSGWCCRPRR